jgi:hypothetical protein
MRFGIFDDPMQDGFWRALPTPSALHQVGTPQVGAALAGCGGLE